MSLPWLGMVKGIKCDYIFEQSTTLLEEIRKPSVLVPFLSQKAISDCFDNIAKLDDCDPISYLSRVANSTEALELAKHINVGNGLYWLKRGRTTDRYLVSVEGWRMLVWRAIREDQEGANYASKVKVNPDSERRAYSPFMRVDSDSYYEFK